MYMITTITFGICFQRRGSEVKFVQGIRIHVGKMDHKKRNFYVVDEGWRFSLILKILSKKDFM
jgi:hypothetical protein